VTLRTAIRNQLATRAPKLEEAAVRAVWRRRNRDRALPSDQPLAPGLRELIGRLRTEGVCVTDAGTVFGDRALFEAAADVARELHERPRERAEAEAGTKATYLTKLATGSYRADHPFVRLAVHPSVLAVANSYLRLRSTLRLVDLWLTEPTPGPAIQTQLWHRDADDVMNVKVFIYFTDVTRGAGPLCYAPRTHPLGTRRSIPGHDEQNRSTDEELATVVPAREWIYCEGGPGTVVFADTCGYHKQTKPTSDERLLLVSQYASGTPYVARAVDFTAVDGAALTDDQYVAVFGRPRD
jgi:hypothetical protein